MLDICWTYVVTAFFQITGVRPSRPSAPPAARPSSSSSSVADPVMTMMSQLTKTLQGIDQRIHHLEMRAPHAAIALPLLAAEPWATYWDINKKTTGTLLLLLFSFVNICLMFCVVQQTQQSWLSCGSRCTPPTNKSRSASASSSARTPFVSTASILGHTAQTPCAPPVGPGRTSSGRFLHMFKMFFAYV